MGGAQRILPDRGDATVPNEVRAREPEFADLISRETGKPLWEARTEVAAVVHKVEISANAYLERTPMRKLEAALGSKIAVRHKPHGVLAVLGPYNFPAHLPNGHIVPALIAGNAVVFKPSEKTPAVGSFLVDCYRAAGIPEGVVRVLIGGPAEGKALAGQAGIDGLLFTGSARAGMSLHRQFADAPHKILEARIRTQAVVARPSLTILQLKVVCGIGPSESRELARRQLQ